MLLYFLRSVCTIQSDAINFQPVLPSFAIFHAFNDLFWELNDLKIEKHYKWTLKKLKLGMVSSIRPHSMWKRVERITAKTGRTSCTNWTISVGVLEFRTRTHLLHGHFNVFKLIWTPDYFCVQYASFKETSSISNTFWHHLMFFSHLPSCLES